MRYCKDCNHLHEGSISLWCNSPKREIDKVTGTHKVMFASTARNWEEYCGQHAVWFEEKVVEPKLVWWQRLLKRIIKWKLNWTNAL